MKNKKIFLVILTVSILGIVGGTFAYFSTTELFNNTFGTSSYQIYSYEVFESPEQWKPGDVTEHKLYVKNEGEMDVAVRITYTESWKDYNGNTLSLFDDNNNRAAIINFSENFDDSWYTYEISHTYPENGYSNFTSYEYQNAYIYKKPLKPGETTETLIDSITFNPNLDDSSASTRTCEYDEVTSSTTCKEIAPSHVGGTYTIQFTIETVQYEVYKEAMNIKYPIGIPTQVGVYKLYGDSIDTFGSTLCIKDECFHVMGEADENHIKLLPYYNLKYGYDTYCPWGCGIRYEYTERDQRYGLQSPMFSSGNYSGSIGTISFWKDPENSSADPYWVNNESYGTGDYIWVYDDNTPIKAYVDNYVQLLNSYGAVATGRLMNQSEAEMLFNNGNTLPVFEPSTTSNNESVLIDPKGTDWAGDRAYWLGFAHENKVVHYSTMWSSLMYISPSVINYAGIRPVIIIEKPQE